MKKFFKGLFIFFEVLFVIEIIALAYFWFADPLGIVKYFNGESPAHAIVSDAAGDAVSDNPVVNTDQAAALSGLGIDPASLPTEIDASMEKCLTEAVGQARAKEIIDGVAPTAVDFFKAKDCL